MSLTKATYSMIKGAVVNVFDFMTPAQIASVQARDGVEDVSAPIQAAIDSTQTTVTVPWDGLRTALSNTIHFPAGDYYVKTPISIVDGYGLIIEGSGLEGTQIFWDTDDNTATLFEFVDCNSCQIRQLSLFANEPVKHLVQIYNSPSLANVVSTSNTLQDVNLNGNFKTYACVWVGGGLDANNDFMNFVRVKAMGYNHSAFFLSGFQSHQNHFFDCDAQGLAFDQVTQGGLYGVFSQPLTPGSNAAASFIWERGVCGGHSGADFFQGGATSLGCHIYWANSENTYRLFETSNTTFDNTPINIVGCRVETNKMAADGYIIDIGMIGPVKIQNCSIGSAGTTAGILPKIRINDTRQMIIDVSSNQFVFQNTTSGASTYDASSLEIANVSNQEFAQVIFQNNFFGGPKTPAEIYTSVGQSTVPVYFGYGPYRFNNASPQNVSTLTPAYPWQKVLLYINDGNTTFTSAGNIDLKNKTMPYTPGVAAQLELIYNPWTSKWTETNAQT
jgi:hypothetical protein